MRETTKRKHGGKTKETKVRKKQWEPRPGQLERPAVKKKEDEEMWYEEMRQQSEIDTWKSADTETWRAGEQLIQQISMHDYGAKRMSNLRILRPTQGSHEQTAFFLDYALK